MYKCCIKWFHELCFLVNFYTVFLREFEFYIIYALSPAIKNCELINN